ncbi:hypothetical protein HanPI659440_Chr07g0262461 [Helianthus annuus]|nr:hypothetical protein HanPI659440_Chr07g0262461 [Helianthus annuus]
MVSVIPPVLKGPRSLEVTTSLVTYTLLWVSSTYLKWNQGVVTSEVEILFI